MKYSVVIADDEPIIRMDIKDILIEEGYDVVGEASDGIDAIELCKKHRPDLVIMDIKMPFLDGLRVSKKITSDKLTTAVIIISAFANKENIEKAKEAGVTGYLVKPLDIKSLIPMIEVCIHKEKLNRDLQFKIYDIEKKSEERKVIEKAKGILMVENNISESEAYKMMRKLSMNKRCPLVDIADVITLNYE